MRTATELDARLERLSTEIDAWIRDFFEQRRPASARFAGLLSYPLGWVDVALQPLTAPAEAGKRLRPTLCLLTCEAVGQPYRDAMSAAAAVELIHNFSLVHDDIQDESLFRRGRPTVWAEWNTAQAINVGDSLFSLAQLALLHNSSHLESSPELLIEAARRLNHTCLRLVEGQFRDLELQSAGSASFEDYQTMVEGKTAALMGCSAWLGAWFGRANLERAELFADFGRQLGLAFQFQDDFLGVWGDPDVTGKPADGDLRARKQALPAVLGLGETGTLGEQFRNIFARPGAMDEDDAHRGALVLEALGIRDRVIQMVEAAYSRAEEQLRAALGGQCDSPLWPLVQRFRDRLG